MPKHFSRLCEAMRKTVTTKPADWAQHMVSPSMEKIYRQLSRTATCLFNKGAKKVSTLLWAIRDIGYLQCTSLQNGDTLFNILIL